MRGITSTVMSERRGKVSLMDVDDFVEATKMEQKQSSTRARDFGLAH